MGFCPKKYIPSAKTLYKVDLSNINFNYLCVDSSNDLSYFLNHKSFFTTQLLRIFLAQTLHSFYKSSPSNCKFSEIPLLRLIHQIPDVIFEIKSVFLQSLDVFSVSREIILPVLFRLYVLLAKAVHQSANFATARIKIHQIPNVIFGTKNQFLFKLCITLQCHET